MKFLYHILFAIDGVDICIIDWCVIGLEIFITIVINRRTVIVRAADGWWRIRISIFRRFAIIPNWILVGIKLNRDIILLSRIEKRCWAVNRNVVKEEMWSSFEEFIDAAYFRCHQYGSASIWKRLSGGESILSNRSLAQF